MNYNFFKQKQNQSAKAHGGDLHPRYDQIQLNRVLI